MRRARTLAPAAFALACFACGGHHEHEQDHGSGAGAAEHATEHAHKAPHGGVLVALGDELAHVELLHEPEDAALTAWLLDAEAEKPLRSAQGSLTLVLGTGTDAFEIQLAARASALTGETVGDTSEFRAEDERLRAAALEGRIARVEVLGRVFENVPVEPEDH